MSQYGNDGEEEASPRSVVDPEFKAVIVELCLAGDRSVAQVAQDFDLTVDAVRGWVKQHEINAGTQDGLTTDEKEGLSRLRRENRPRLMRRQGSEEHCKRRWRRTTLRGADEQRALDLIERHFGPSAELDRELQFRLLGDLPPPGGTSLPR